MNKKISDIKVREGWVMRTENGGDCPRLLIEKDVEFDLFTFCDTPYFVAPIRIDDQFAPYVDVDTFVARNTVDPLETVLDLWTS